MTDEEVLASQFLSKQEKFEILVKNNVGLFRSEALRFNKTNSVCDLEDYEQEAKLTLFEYVIDNFNPAAGVKFSTYLTTCIRNAIKKQASRFKSPLTVTSKARQIMFKIQRLQDKEVTKENILKILNLDEEVYDNYIFLMGISRLDSSFEDSFTEIPTKLIIEDAALTDKEKKVVELRQTRTLAEVGKIIGCSPEWVRRIEKSAIDKVKAVL